MEFILISFIIYINYKMENYLFNRHEVFFLFTEDITE